MISQNKLIEKILLYLKDDLKTSTPGIDINNRKKVIEYFENCGGLCNGLSILWAYGLKLEDTEQPQDKAIDGVSFLRKTLKFFEDWNGKDTISVDVKKDFDRLTNNIILYQEALQDFDFGDKGSQVDFLKYRFADTQNRKIIKDLSLNIVLVESMLIKKLEGIVKKGMMVFIDNVNSSGGHIVSIYQDSIGKVHFYDPNVGEFEFENVNNELAAKVWHSTHIKNKFGGQTLNEHIFHNMMFESARFEKDQEQKYPLAVIRQMTGEEFLAIFNKNPSLLIKKTQLQDLTQLITKLFSQLKKEDGLLILENKEVDSKVKEFLLAYYNYNIFLLDDKQKEKLHTINADLIRLPVNITLKEVLNKIAKNPKDQDLVDKLFDPNTSIITEQNNITDHDVYNFLKDYCSKAPDVLLSKMLPILIKEYEIKISLDMIKKLDNDYLLKVLLKCDPNHFSNKDALIKFIKNEDKYSEMASILVLKLKDLVDELTHDDRIFLLSRNINNWEWCLPNSEVGNEQDGAKYKEAIKMAIQQRFLGRMSFNETITLVVKLLTKVIQIMKITYSVEELKELRIPEDKITGLLNSANGLLKFTSEACEIPPRKQSECLDLKFRRYGCKKGGLEILESELYKLLKAPNVKTVDLSLNDIGNDPLKGDRYDLFKCFSTSLINVSKLVLQANNFEHLSSGEISELFKSLPSSLEELNLSVCNIGANGKRTIDELINIFNSLPRSLKAINLHYNGLGYIAATNGNEAWQKVLSALPKDAIIDWGTQDTKYLNKCGTLKGSIANTPKF